MCNDLIISELHPYNFATIDILELKKGFRKVHLGEVTDSQLHHKFSQFCLCKTEGEYMETYIEQILSHETIHFVLYDIFRDLLITKQLDSFDI